MILVQREFTVPREHRAVFERQSREGLWPAFLHFVAQMVAFGSWGFGASSEPLVSHTVRSEEHTSELQSLMRHSYAVFCLEKKKPKMQIKKQHKQLQRTTVV